MPLRGHYAALTDMRERIDRERGFHGVRAQSWGLFEVRRAHGYMDPLPTVALCSAISVK